MAIMTAEYLAFLTELRVAIQHVTENGKTSATASFGEGFTIVNSEHFSDLLCELEMLRAKVQK